MSRVTRRSRERDCHPDRVRTLYLTRLWAELRAWGLVLTMAAWTSWPPDRAPFFEGAARVGTTFDTPNFFPPPHADLNSGGLEPPSFCCDGLLGRPGGWDDADDAEDDDDEEESVTALLALTGCRAWYLDAPGASPRWDDAGPSRALFLTLLRFRC